MKSAANTQSLRDACMAWQGGRDGGSSPIRAAARVLTGTAHYFEADFITQHERAAAADDVLLGSARTLLEALESSPVRDATGWARSTGLTSDWAGRGIRSGAQDAQIAAALKSGSISMPLWGLSLDRETALSFGSAFLLELTGPFPAIPAWHISGVKDQERELIAGGRYAVTRCDETEDGVVVGLQFDEAIRA